MDWFSHPKNQKMTNDEKEDGTDVRGAVIEVIKESLIRRHSPSGWPFFPPLVQREKATAVRPTRAHLSLLLQRPIQRSGCVGQSGQSDQ